MAHEIEDKVTVSSYKQNQFLFIGQQAIARSGMFWAIAGRAQQTKLTLLSKTCWSFLIKHELFVHRYTKYYSNSIDAVLHQQGDVAHAARSSHSWKSISCAIASRSSSPGAQPYRFMAWSVIPWTQTRSQNSCLHWTVTCFCTTLTQSIT